MFSPANCLNSSTTEHNPLPDTAVSKLYQNGYNTDHQIFSCNFFLGNPSHGRRWDNGVKIMQGSSSIPPPTPNLNRSGPVLPWKWTPTLLTWAPGLGFFWHKDCKLTQFQCLYSVSIQAEACTRYFWHFLYKMKLLERHHSSQNTQPYLTQGDALPLWEARNKAW